MNKIDKFNFAIKQQEEYMQQERDWENEEIEARKNQVELEQEDSPAPERTLQMDLRDHIEENDQEEFIGNVENSVVSLTEEANTIKENFKNGIYNDDEAEIHKDRLIEIDSINNEKSIIEGEKITEEIEQPLHNDILQNEMYKMQNDEETKSNDIEKTR